MIDFENMETAIPESPHVFQQRPQSLFGSLSREPGQVGQSGERFPLGMLGEGFFDTSCSFCRCGD